MFIRNSIIILAFLLMPLYLLGLSPKEKASLRIANLYNTPSHISDKVEVVIFNSVAGGSYVRVFIDLNQNELDSVTSGLELGTIDSEFLSAQKATYGVATSFVIKEQHEPDHTAAVSYRYIQDKSQRKIWMLEKLNEKSYRLHFLHLDY